MMEQLQSCQEISPAVLVDTNEKNVKQNSETDDF